MTRRIVVVSAGLGVPSSTRLLADLLAEASERAIEARGVEVEVRHVELRGLAHALTDHLLTGFPSKELAEAIDAILRTLREAGASIEDHAVERSWEGSTPLVPAIRRILDEERARR